MAKDKFDQFMHLSVTQSAANALTFGQVAIGGAVFEYAGIIFTRVEYYLEATAISELVANADALDLALTGSDGLTDLSVDQPQLYDRITLEVAVSGAPATAQIIEMPIIHDFSSMPGGGLMVPAQTLFIGMDSAGCAAAQTGVIRAYYHVEKLTAADFIELVQRYRVLST